MQSLQYMPSRWSRKTARSEQKNQGFWERVESIAKVVSYLVAALVSAFGLLGVWATAVGQAYIHAYYQAKGVPVGLLPFKVPENNFLGWIYLAFTMSDLFTALVVVSGLTGLVTIMVTMLLGRLRRQVEQARMVLLVLALGALGIVLVSLWRKLVLPWWAYYLVIPVGFAGLIIWWLFRSSQEQETGLKRQIGVILHRLIAVSGSLLGIALCIVASLWIALSAMTEAGARGWENGCTRVIQSPEIIFSTKSENPDIQQFVPTISKQEESSALYKGWLLFKTDDSYYIFTATITVTNPFTGNLWLFPREVATYGCAPAQIVVIPATDLHIVKLIPRDKPLSCGQDVEP